MLGGTAIYVAGTALFKWAIAGEVGYSHLIAIAALGAIALAAESLAPLALMTTTALVLVALVIVEERKVADHGRPTRFVACTDIAPMPGRRILLQEGVQRSSCRYPR